MNNITENKTTVFDILKLRLYMRIFVPEAALYEDFSLTSSSRIITMDKEFCFV